ncbi:MAG: FAD binding domain-containing protein [Sphaerochaetaceae bacterium]
MYYRVQSLKDALVLKQKKSEQLVFLGGGTEIRRLASSVIQRGVISLKDLKLDAIIRTDDQLSIGALTTFQQALDSPFTPPFLAEALRFCGSKTRRNMATIGGNIATSRDDSYLMSTLVAAKARVLLCNLSQNGKVVEENLPIREYHFFFDHFQDSLITAVVLNKPQRFVSSLRFAKTVQSPAALTISFGADISSASARDVRICAAIKGSNVVRLVELEEAISTAVYQSPSDVTSADLREVTFVDDITGSAAYKRYLVQIAVSELYGRCLQAIKAGGTV